MNLMPRNLDDRLRDRRARVVSWLDRHTEAETTIAVCERWIADLLARDLRLYSWRDLDSLPADLSLIDRLSAEKLEGLSAALVWKIAETEGTEPNEAALIDYALAVAGGHAYALHATGKLDWIGHFVASIDGALWDDLADSAAGYLGANPNALEAFVDFLASIVTKANEAPETVIEIPARYASMALIFERFAQAGSFQEVWEAHQWPMMFRSSAAFEILRRADSERFVEMVDQLPHPTLVNLCLRSKALLASPHDALILLRLANKAFDAEGHWQRSGMVAILVLRLVGEQLLLARSDETGETEDLGKDAAQFGDAVGAVLDVLFERSDGVELAWHWLENILRETPSVPHAGRSGAPKQIIKRIGILAHAVSCRMTPRCAQNDWIREAEPLARQFRAVTVLSVAAFTTNAADLDVGSIAKSLVKSECFELLGAKNLIHPPGAPLRTLPGDILAGIPEAATWFISTWSALRFERERAWRAKKRNSNPAEIIGLWGLGAVESFVMSGQARQGAAAGMWLAVEQVFREARLVEPRLGQDFWSQALARLFGWWPQIFSAGDDLTGLARAESFDAAALGRTLAAYAEISLDFMGIIVSLRQAGLPSSMLDNAVQKTGLDLQRMIRRFLQTARRLDSPLVWNPEWVASLRRIVVEIASRATISQEQPFCDRPSPAIGECQIFHRDA